MKTPNEADLRRSMKDLAFEFYYFELYGRLIQERSMGVRTPYPAAFRHAVGYVFLIHLRSLIDFFFGKSSRDDDLLVSDFRRILPGFAASFPSPKVPDGVKDLREAIGKRLAHITTRRWHDPAPSMDYYHKHYRDICGLVSSFKAALPPDMLKDLQASEDEWVRRGGDLGAKNP